MTEGITYNPLGTVDVTFDDKTYHLGRPKFRQFKYFTEQLEAQRNEMVEALEALNEETAQSEEKHAKKPNSPEARAEAKRLQTAMTDITRKPFYERTIGIITEMFAQVGDPLPDDEDEWPAWLAADSSLPGEILKHWRTNPKASGPPSPS